MKRSRSYLVEYSRLSSLLVTWDVRRRSAPFATAHTICASPGVPKNSGSLGRIQCRTALNKTKILRGF